MTFLLFLGGWVVVGIVWLCLVTLLDKVWGWPRQTDENTFMTVFGLVSCIVSFWPLLVLIIPALRERFA